MREAWNWQFECFELVSFLKYQFVLSKLTIKNQNLLCQWTGNNDKIKNQKLEWILTYNLFVLSNFYIFHVAETREESIIFVFVQPVSLSVTSLVHKYHSKHKFAHKSHKMFAKTWLGFAWTHPSLPALLNPTPLFERQRWVCKFFVLVLWPR